MSRTTVYPICAICYKELKIITPLKGVEVELGGSYNVRNFCPNSEHNLSNLEYDGQVFIRMVDTLTYDEATKTTSNP